jgi:hypothetical protein
MERAKSSKSLTMKDYVALTKDRIQRELARSAMGYFKVGLQSLHEERKSTHPLIEPAIGNLATAIELMLKAFLAKNNLILLFSDLPLELKILFTCPDNLLSDSRSWRYLDELVASFYVFYPGKRQALGPYFRLLSRCRNASIHLSLPSFQRYELERTAYLALSIFEILDKEKYPPSFYHGLTKEDKQFLSEYNEERIERVRGKIEVAKEKGKKAKDMWILADSWDTYERTCPICGCGGMLMGETQVEADFDGDGAANPYLIFLADTFQCDGCGISLDDVEELKLAGMDIVYQRSDSDMDKWWAEQEPTDYSEY